MIYEGYSGLALSAHVVNKTTDTEKHSLFLMEKKRTRCNLITQREKDAERSQMDQHYLHQSKL